MVEQHDWRLQGQERYMTGLAFRFAKYRKPSATWDHDHCEFCGTKFMEEDYSEVLHEGYTTEDEYRWVCPQCFEDFKERFQWSMVENSGPK